MAEQLRAADIFLTRGKGAISRAIRFFTRKIGEPRTKASHVGIVVEDGPLQEAMVVEALLEVKRHPLFSQYGGKKGSDVAIYRPINLSDEEREIVVNAAENYVDRKYGFFQLVGHLGDWFLQGAYFFRRFTGSDKYPICSWVVAHAFAKAEKYFGVPPRAASPDDIHDFVEKNPEKYQEIRPFKPLDEG